MHLAFRCDATPTYCVSKCIYLESLFNNLYIHTKFDMVLNKNLRAAIFSKSLQFCLNFRFTLALTVEAMKELWRKEFLPSIRREMKAEIDSIKTDIKKIEARFDKIEESQAFLSDKYDGIIETLQSSKKQAAAAEAKAKD